MSQGYSLVTGWGLLITVASVVAEHWLQGMLASIVVAHGLSCPMACGIFLDQGSNSCLLHLAERLFNHWNNREVQCDWFLTKFYYGPPLCKTLSSYYVLQIQDKFWWQWKRQMYLETVELGLFSLSPTFSSPATRSLSPVSSWLLPLPLAVAKLIGNSYVCHSWPA